MEYLIDRKLLVNEINKFCNSESSAYDILCVIAKQPHAKYEKETEKEVIFEDVEENLDIDEVSSLVLCPTCNYSFVPEEFGCKYCSNCGQKLGWADDVLFCLEEECGDLDYPIYDDLDDELDDNNYEFEDEF